MAAPFVIHQTINNTGSNRVSMDIAGQAQKISIIFYNDAFKTPLEKMTVGMMAKIEFAGVEWFQTIAWPLTSWRQPSLTEDDNDCS